MGIEERIINACTELAQTQGLRNFTMDELATQAGVSKRTIYRYYRSKEEIVEAALVAFMNTVAAEADRIMESESDPLTIINHILNYLFINGRFIISEPSLNDLSRYYPELWKKIEQFRSERISMIIEIISSKQPSANDIDPLIMRTAILASIQAVLNPDFILGNGLSFKKTAEQLSRFLMAAVIKES